MSYCILDLETTSTTSFKRVANPFDERNRVILMALKLKEKEAICLEEGDFKSFFDKLPFIKYLIGQNFKFDMLYLWHMSQFKQWIKDGGKVWDIGLVEYMLTAQEHLFPSLDEMSKKYGGNLKDNNIKELFLKNEAVNEEHRERLIEYAKEDVLNTELIFLKQIETVKKYNLQRLVAVHMNYLLATTEMEFNGIFIDKSKIDIVKQDLVSQIKDMSCYLEDSIKPHFNWQSNDHISAFFFGGEIEYRIIIETKIRQTGLKIGQEFHKYEYKIHKFKRQIRPLKEWKTAKENIYSTAVKILESIDHPAARDLVHNRKINKQLNTYIEALPELIQSDDRIHHTLNHTKTATSRLSSDSPNLQNIPKGTNSSIKEIFTSKSASSGCLIEADASQLEVCCAASVFKDKQLIKDILDGVDFHRMNAAVMFHKDPEDITDIERFKAKAATFGILYGNGAKRLSDTTGLSEEAANDYIMAFYDKYKQIKEGHDRLVKEVQKSRIPMKTSTGYQGKGLLVTEYGRRYSFIEKDWYNRNRECFNLPQIKDYTIQGLAGDILAVVIGELYKQIIDNPHYLLINTIHDSIMLDCEKIYLKECLTSLNKVLYTTNTLVKEKLNYDLLVPIKWEIKVGNNWKNMTLLII